MAQGVVEDAASASMRVTFKTVKKGMNEKYVIGYCIKDEGLAHSVIICIGLSDEEKTEARNVYIAKASEYDQSQSKMNKTPLKTIKKQVAFKANNAFTLSGWFIAKHALVAVASSLTLPLTIAYCMPSPPATTASTIPLLLDARVPFSTKLAPPPSSTCQ